MTKKHLVVDPITRIEGHLRIEAIIDENNVITDAYSSSTMFRGIEEILKGRDPRDCGLLAMRICGVCTGTHYQRSIEAVEHAFAVGQPGQHPPVVALVEEKTRFLAGLPIYPETNAVLAHRCRARIAGVSGQIAVRLTFRVFRRQRLHAFIVDGF